jgi:hypothetical protein
MPGRWLRWRLLARVLRLVENELWLNSRGKTYMTFGYKERRLRVHAGHTLLD